MIGKTNSQVGGGGIKGEKVNISLLTNQPEHSALMGAAITVKYGESETQYVWEGVGITVTIPPYEDYEVSVSGVAGYKTPEVFTATAQADNARSLNFEYKAERVKVTLSAVGGADMNGTTVNIYGQEYTFSGTPIEVLVPFDETYSVQGGAFGSLVAPLAQSFTASIPLREINLEYRTCVLVVNMLSNQVSDATIAALKASVKYGSTTIEVANGVMVDIPSGTDITVTFPEVENYNTPSAVTFTSVNGLNTQSVTYTTEKVVVNASANDGKSVDGQTVILDKVLRKYKVSNGVYIQSTDGMLHDETEWDGTKTANGIAVIGDRCKFVMALSDIAGTKIWGSGVLVNGIVTTTDLNEAKSDFGGEPNTDKIISQLGTGNAPAFESASSYKFPDGKYGYLPSVGELNEIYKNKSAISSAMSKCGGTVMGNSWYWSSTQYHATAGWNFNYGSGDIQGNGKTNAYYVRPCTTLDDYEKFPTEYIEVTNNKAEFKVAHGLEYDVTMSAKDGYSTPAMQSFVADSVSRYVNMEYQLSGLKLNIASNQGNNDTALADVKALVTYGSNSVELGNGDSLSLSANTEVTITFPDVPDYKTPEPITFTHTSGYSEKTGTYLTEKVTVDVSANDGEDTDGQVVTVAKNGMKDFVPDFAAIDEYGVAIMDIYGKFYKDADSWQAAGSPTANGIAVSDGTHRFCIAKVGVTHVASTGAYADFEYWGANNVTVSGVTTTQSTAGAKADFYGVANTDAIVENVKSSDGKFTVAPWSAAGLCRQFAFPNGSKGYMGAGGEWSLVQNSIDSVNTLLTAIGGTKIDTSGSPQYWASTQYGSTSAWRWDFSTKTITNYNKPNNSRVRAFSSLETVKLEDETSETHEVTNGEVTFKAAHGTDYTVSVDSKGSYKTPASKSFTAQLIVNNVSMEYQKIVATDLSKQDVHGNKIAQTTANCYVVSEAGDYMIPIAYGAAIKNGQVNAASFTNNGGANSHDFVNYLGNAITSPYVETDTGSVATSVQMSISDTENAVTNLGIVDGDGCKYISFSVPSVPKTGGNAVISVKDADGVIMWNWHIWLWEDDLTPVEITNYTPVAYNIMPVNLGSKWDEDAKTHIKNWFYQFGRPTPLLCPSAYNSTSDHASYGVLSYAAASIASNIQTGIKNPATFFGYDSSYNSNWFQTNSGKTYNLWDAACTSTGKSDNNVVKTIYDPCPIGFKMPNGNTFTGFSKTNVVGSFANGWKFKRYSDDTVGVFFPASGYRIDSDGSLNGVGLFGYVWLSSAYSQTFAHYLYAYASNVTPQSRGPRANGLSVRPITDTPLEGQTKITKIRIDQTITDPEAMITRIVDLGGIEAVRANSHRYTGEVVDGVMQLKQLKDTDGTKYLDGSAATLTTVGTDVWMKLPQFYWKCVQVQTDVFDFYVAYGAKPDDTYKTWDGKDLIGAYEVYKTSSKLYSVSNKVSTGDESQADCKSYARARGEGFTLVKWKHHCMMAMLYYTQYSNTNCQAKIGKGTDSYVKRTGATNSLGMTDTVAGGNGDSNSINFWGLENWWGNKKEWMDNIVVDARVWKITEDDGTVRQAGTGGSSDGWTTKLLFGENIDLIPMAVGGSETTGFSDYYHQSSSNSRVVRRSNHSANADDGVAFVRAEGDSSGKYGDVGSRLAYYGDYTIIE